MREEKMAIDRASSFPEADVDQALNPSQNKEFEVDPVSSDIATSGETRQAARKREREKQDAMHKLKTTILVSAMIIAVAGAVFAVTKKLRER
ncbi:uncharacterized protein LOC133688414 [Populus nigra]|uniref:uncharacterized protein LOC133688414 n=1 Tax=Populus nigra TaxID=3691 RepID=UPI002B270151|nr:uncharacterized protein LOC133688414 [Populus nigra]